ncbi:hypothetical protein Tco_1556726 [Tanacetum coccineum]
MTPTVREGVPVTIPEHSGIGAREDAATLTGDVDNLWKIEKLRSGLIKTHTIRSALSCAKYCACVLSCFVCMACLYAAAFFW